MSLNKMLEMFTMLPKFMDSVKQMSPEEKYKFVQQLGLEGEEQEAALRILDAYQSGQPLSAEDQAMAQKLLEKGLEINNLDLGGLLEMLSSMQ
ncbi:MAG: hypothetical protein WBL58_04945 [Peptococcia bacterium]